MPLPSHDSKIVEIENGLTSVFKITGQPKSQWSLAERMRHYGVPGVSVAVVEGGALRWAQGFGVKLAGGQEPVTAETIFQAASISKPVAAMAALKLVETGQLCLDEDVNHFLKNWRVPENDFTRQAPVTLRGLLSHTAGLTVHGFEGYPAGHPIPDVEQVLDGLAPANSPAVRVDLLPGTQMRYSGGGYTVLQRLIEDVTGRPFAQVMRELVLGPLGMSNSAYAHPLPASDAPRVAQAHQGDGSPYPGGWYTYPELAAAGLWTTPSDLARFALEVQAAYNGQGGAVLSQQTARAFLEPQLNPVRPGVNAMDYGGNGLGLFLSECQGTLFFEHTGSNTGYRCQLLASIRDGRCAVVMTNGENGDLLRGEVMMSIGAAYGWSELEVIEKAEAALDPDLLRYGPGLYELMPGQSLQVIVQDGAIYLKLRENGGPLLRLHPSSAREAFLAEMPLSVKFTGEADGRITALEIMGMQARKVG